eukprot:jgi/Ulvmu1/9456/UM052_0022.1
MMSSMLSGRAEAHGRADTRGLAVLPVGITTQHASSQAGGGGGGGGGAAAATTWPHLTNLSLDINCTGCAARCAAAAPPGDPAADLHSALIRLAAVPALAHLRINHSVPRQISSPDAAATAAAG